MDEREFTGGSGTPDSGRNTAKKRRPRPAGTGAEGTGAPRRRRSDPADSAAGSGERKVRRRRPEADGEPRPRRKRPAEGSAERRTARGTGSAPAEKRRRRPPQEASADRLYSKRQEKPPKKKRTGLIVALVFLLILLLMGLAVGAFVWKKYGPTKEKYDLNTYFGIDGEGLGGMTLNNEVLEAQYMKIDGTAYVKYEFVRDFLNDRFYWDPYEGILLYTLPEGMLKAGADSTDYTVSGETKSEKYVILKTEESTAYIALDFVQKYTNMEFKFYENPNRIFIVNDFSEARTAKVKKDTPVRCLGGFKSPILTEVKAGEKIIILEDVSDWKKVRTENGFVGYMRKSRLGGEKMEAEARDFEEPQFSSIQKDYKINLAWHQVTNEVANGTLKDAIASTKGLNTISPTWFTVADNTGNVTSIASADYVSQAHQAGMEVWALVDNFGEGIDDLELLSHTTARDKMISQLISETLRVGADGINVDFEQIQTDAGEHYIQFIRELSIQCRANNLVLSVDNYVPKGYNTHYHRKEQGIMADYVIIMGYDEHFGGSYEAGSVASYNYVKEGIEETMKEVPAEKIINAVPFYTRLWNETPKTAEELAEQQGTEAADYPMKVTSEALGMSEAAGRVANAGVSAAWDEATKQNYASWTGSDGSTYKIWLEDTSSLEAKLQLMKDNGLAGTAAWKLGFETSDVWDLISQYVN